MANEPDAKKGLRIFFGLSDFILSIGCGLLILLCFILLTSLIHWIDSDIKTTFSGLFKDINNAVIIDKEASPTPGVPTPKP